MAADSEDRTTAIPGGVSDFLSVRRPARLRRVMRQTGLAAGEILDLALELLDIASQRIAPSPIHRTGVGLGAARWRNVSTKERSRLLRRAAEARWAKYRAANGESTAAAAADRDPDAGDQAAEAV